MSKSADKPGHKLIARNKQAFRDFFISDRFEAGLVLVGTEVKSLRDHRVNLDDAHAEVRNGQAYLINCRISPYPFGNRFNHEPSRTRKLLLHKDEIRRLGIKVNERGFTLVPTAIYFSRGKAKVEIGLAKGKREYDKRRTIKDREVARELRAASRRH